MEGLTREEWERHCNITVEKSRQLPADDGEHDTLVLVRNDIGWWGTAIECCGEESPLDAEDVIWFIDEATARRDFDWDETLEATDCDVCGRSMDHRVARQSPEGNIVACPACWARGEAKDAALSRTKGDER